MFKRSKKFNVGAAIAKHSDIVSKFFNRTNEKCKRISNHPHKAFILTFSKNKGEKEINKALEDYFFSTEENKIFEKLLKEANAVA